MTILLTVKNITITLVIMTLNTLFTEILLQTAQIRKPNPGHILLFDSASTGSSHFEGHYKNLRNSLLRHYFVLT